MSGFVKLSPVLERADHMLFFSCPGCKMLHGINVDIDGVAKWDWDGNADAPTFSPSILVRFDWGEKREKMVCHSFVRKGQIEFLGDCTHELAGQTVGMVQIGEGE